ncbi:MAG: FAD-binding oxidoreductase [Nitrospinota bacterium]
MSDLRVTTTTGKDVVLEEATVEEFKSSLRGELLLAEDPDYDDARALWNAMIDRRPALIARSAGAADVIRSVKLASDHGLLVSVRGGGHNIAGNAVCDGGLMIDLSPMNGVRVDSAARTAWVDPGATLGDVDHETQAFGLATPLGINSTTGVAGLTLGGGFGWLSRKHGLTVDNLLSADVVTADGELVTASERDNPDLFWGVRGGGGNFGIVTSFQFQLHPVGPEVLSGLIVHRFEDAGEVLRYYRSFVAQAPDDLACWAVLRKAPPLPFLAEEVHGTEILVIAVLHAGDMKEGERLLQPLREFGDPIADVVTPHPYAVFQQAFDPLLTPGVRNYWKSHNFSELSDGAIETILEYAGRLPSPYSEIFVAHLGGAANRVAPDVTAYPHRDVTFVLNVHTRWEDAAQDEECVAWAREFFDATTPFATGGVYVNFISEGEERVRAAYGVNYDRMVELKSKYDPTNLFHMNQNIKPTV